LTSGGLPLADLSVLDELAGYRRHFLDVALWTPYVRIACKTAGLDCCQVRPGLPGTFPMFIVDQNWFDL